MEQDRRHWLFPATAPTFRGVDAASLDPEDIDDLGLLVEAEHPELAAAEEGLDEVVIDGQPMRPRFHLTMHQLVATQILKDDPPEAWATAERLTADGYERHEILHMLGAVAATELWRSTVQRRPFDRDDYIEDLAALPQSWEDEQDGSYEEDPDGWFVEARPPDGTVLTHRLTDAEAAGGFVASSPDLDALGPLGVDHGHLHLAGDAVAELKRLDGVGEVLVGPEGWLGGAGAGDLVGFRLGGDEVEIVAVEGAPESPEWLGPALTAAFHRLNEGDGLPVAVSELIGAALTATDAPGPLVLPPVGGLLAGHGFEVRDRFAAPEGADWEAFGRVLDISAMAVLHGLDPGDAHSLVGLAEMYRRFLLDGLLPDDAGLADELASMLGDADLGRAFVEVVDATASGLDEGLREFTDAVREWAASDESVGLTWFSALVAARTGEHERAEVLLNEALDSDPEHWPSLEDAAQSASDRGDARRAVELLGRLAEMGDEEAEVRAQALLRYVVAPRALARRATTPARAVRAASTSTATWERPARRRWRSGCNGCGRS